MNQVGTDNIDNTNSNNIIFTITDTKLYVPVVTLSARDNQKFLKRLSKGLKDQFIGMDIKQKERIKIQQMNIDTFNRVKFCWSKLIVCFSLYKSRCQC